jgi:hypothetical protein
VEPLLVVLGVAAAAVGVALLVATLRRPVLLLAVYAAVVPWGSGYSIPLGLPPAFQTLSTILGAAATLGLILEVGVADRRAGRFLPAVPAALVFLGVNYLTLAWSPDPGRSREGLLVLTSVVVLYVIASLARPSPADLAHVATGALVGGVITGLIAVRELVTGTIDTTGAGVPRFQLAGGGGGEGADPNITAAVLLLPLAIGVARTFTTTKALRPAYAGATALIGLAIALTGSRGGLLAALAVAVVVTTTMRPSARAALLLVVPITLAAVVVGLFAPDALTARLGEERSSGRTNVWATSLRVCPEHCIKGAGWDMFSSVYGDAYLTTPSARPVGRDVTVRAHNMWIGPLIEGGIASVLALAGIFLFTMRELRHVGRQARAPVLGALAGLLVANMFLSTYSFKYFWLVLIFAAISTTAADEPAVAATA